MSRSDETSPIINWVFNDPTHAQGDQYLKEMMDIYKEIHKLGLNSKQFFKLKLGKQDYCWTGEVRNWIYEGANWRIYVSKKGWSFEALETLSLYEAWDAWQDFYGKIMKLCKK